MMKSTVRYEAVASDPTAVWRIASATNYKTNHKLGNLQNQFTGLQESMNRVEALLQRLVKSQARRLDQSMERCVSHLRPTEGTFKFPSTYPSVVVTGWGEDLLPHPPLACPSLNPSHGPELARQCPQYPRKLPERAKNMEKGVSEEVVPGQGERFNHPITISYPFTHNLPKDIMPADLDWSIVDKPAFIEEVVPNTLNWQVRHFTGSRNTSMVYLLKPVNEEIQKSADESGDRRIAKMCLGMLKAMRSHPENNYIAYRKGIGVNCNKRDGVDIDDFVVVFFGEVYPFWRWYEKQDGIKHIPNNSQDQAPVFYNIMLERPKGDRDGYDLVFVDAMHKYNYTSRICHSCNSNCEAKVTAVDGQYQIRIYTLRPIAEGDKITFDYNSVTGSKEEQEAALKPFIPVNFNWYWNLIVMCYPGYMEAFVQHNLYLLLINRLIDGEIEAVFFKHGSVVIAAINSCTNTSHTSVILGAGFVAKKVCKLGNPMLYVYCQGFSRGYSHGSRVNISRMASAISPSLRIDALQNRTCPETEHVFTDAFWEGFDVVIHALANVNARIYMDRRCLYFQKPLLESGTWGAKCNTQMVIPHLTENYGASRDPPEKQTSMYTIHSSPHNIDYCLTWARPEFEGLLEKTPTEVSASLSNPTEYAAASRNAGDAQARGQLERVIECLHGEKFETFQDCNTWIRLNFEDYFPEDLMISSGAPFWSAPKRLPRLLEFISTDPSQPNFVLAASILRAETFGIPIPDWAKNPKKLAEAVDKVIVPDFQPKQGVKIVTDEKATSLSSASVDDAAVIEELVAKLEEISKTLPPGFHMNPIQFEKDDDTNFHMDVIAGFANMRARNYSIPEVDKLKAKFIAGRIIPAIATSTAMATGLVCLELYKVLAGGHKVEDYRNTFANLAIPLFSMAEPVPPKTIKHQDMTWTVWDRWTITGNITLRELLEWLKEKGLNAYSISCGTSLLYNSMFPRHKDRLDKKVVDVAREVAKVEVPSYRRHLDVVVACEDDDDNDVDIPLVSIYFR